MDKRLEGKVAIVTGGATGIGAAICKLFVEKGAVVYSGINKSRPDFTHDNMHYHKLDVKSVSDCENIVAIIMEKHTNIDILVNNAGITRDSLIEKMTDDMWDDVIDVNLKGAFNITRAVSPIMKSNGKGSIINISSVVGEYGNIGQSNYAASKAGLIGMTKSWAKEMARKGENIRVNAIAPGYIMSDMLKTVPERLLEKFSGLTMLCRLGEPVEIANAALFLASDEASYITAHTLSVNGGMRL